MPAGNFAVADVVMAVVIVVSAVFGAMRGLLREVLSLVIWGAALLGGIAFAEPAAGVLGLDLGAGLQTAIGFAIVFVVLLVAGALVQRLLGGLVESTGLSGTDRTLGLMFGIVRGAVAVLVVLILLRPFAESRQWWTESKIAPPLLTFEKEVIELFDVVIDAVGGPSHDGREARGPGTGAETAPQAAGPLARAGAAGTGRERTCAA